jgi:tetratricopeptide (TPR) repeat protein
VASSGWQIIVSGETGIGFSGVVYAFFGYVLARRRSEPAFAAFVTNRTVGWLLGWLVLCIALTIMKIWAVGNGAHVAGLAFGFFVGTAAEHARFRIPALAGVAVLAIGTVLSCVWLPWSPAWRDRNESAKAYEIALKARQGDPKSMTYIGMHWVRDPERRDEALKLLERAATAGEPTAMNALAWTYATCTDDKVRNAAKAVEWAEKAVAAMPAEAAVVDTLAAAYAEAGRWDEALATQKKALSLLSPDTRPAGRKSIEEHLAAIEKHEPIRDRD